MANPLPAPASGCWLGNTPNQESTQATENKIGRPFAIDQNFHQWTTVFPTAEDNASANAGRIQLLNWKGPGSGGWKAVADGREDAVIDAAAKRVKAFGKLLFITWHHEPENDTNTTDKTPAQYRAAWRRIVTRFRAAGVTNVAWTWKMIGSQNTPMKAAAYDPASPSYMYPGDDVIDWVAWDPYNWAYCRAGTKWRSFLESVDPASGFSFYKAHASHWSSKPLMIAETGTNEGTKAGESKAQWFTQMFADIESGRLGKIKALVYFNAGPPTFCEREIDTSPAALAAFKAGAKRPYFQPRSGGQTERRIKARRTPGERRKSQRRTRPGRRSTD